MFRSPEQSNFNQRLVNHLRSGDAPLLLEGTTGLGKTRAFLSALSEGIRGGKKVTLVLPTHSLIEQILRSDDLQVTVPSEISVMAFQPRRFFENQADYLEHKAKAIEADLMLCTSASMIIDQRLKGDYHGGTQRDYILFDEADQLPEAAALQSDCEITSREFSDFDVKVETFEQALTDLLKKKGLPSELKGRAVLLLEESMEEAWFKSFGKTDDGGVMLYHKMPGRLLKRIANQSNVAFISATLSIAGRFDDFKRSLGIQAESNLSACIEPSRHGAVDFHVAALEVDSPEWLASTVRVIQNSPKPCLVATSSHRLAQQLASLVPEATVRGDDETAGQAASRIGSAEILIAAGAWAGLDTKIRWKSIVVPRIPYERPVVLDDQIESSFLHTRNTAIRRMRQVIGRGLRTPDAECMVYIMDGRFENISSFVPTRFRDQWQQKGFLEGQRIEVTLSKAERDPAVRRKALQHFGRKCMVCDFTPRVDSQLDVHHLFPLADGGERVTKIDDVAVLCANCHRLAHSTSPPLSIEQLREVSRSLCEPSLNL
jgi:Rad3-related DNA helicase